MNTNPNAIRILCYGDSNTWGDTPDGKPRYAANIRWPGKLQQLLGSDYEIIEEGLCGRTTDLDDPKEEGRNGKTYLSPCLKTHKPIDIFILLLGTNDLKAIYNRSPEEVANSVNGLLSIVKDSGSGPEGKSPKIVLISPTLLVETTEKYKGATEKSKQLGSLLEKVASDNSASFIDLAKHMGPGEDGAHLIAESHTKIADLVADIIKTV